MELSGQNHPHAVRVLVFCINHVHSIPHTIPYARVCRPKFVYFRVKTASGLLMAKQE